MKLTHVVLHRLELPLVSPFRTSYGVEVARHPTLVQVVGPDGEGWGECVAEAAPLYTSEFADGAYEVIKRFLLPRLSGAVRAEEVAGLFSPVRGNFMAKAAIEAALLDADCRADNVSMAEYFGATSISVAAGVAVGMQPSMGELLDVISRYVAEGYGRVKLKIEPGADVDVVRAVRNAFPDLLLQVDANAAYRVADAGHLAQLDEFDLLLIEQPLPEDDLIGHAELAKQIRTPLCLDESITSLGTAVQAVRLGSCSVVNVKPGRVGGLLEAKKIHDFCVAEDVALWCGGMLETGIGRASNVALAALPGFSIPGDLSASARYFHRDVTDAFVLNGGRLDVPTGPGLGVVPNADALREFTVGSETISLQG